MSVIHRPITVEECHAPCSNAVLGLEPEHLFKTPSDPLKLSSSPDPLSSVSLLRNTAVLLNLSDHAQTLPRYVMVERMIRSIQ